MASKSEVTIRCFQPEDSFRCRTMFAEGMRGLCIPAMKTFYPDFLKVAGIFLVLVAAIAVKWSMWNWMGFSFVAFVVLTAAGYIYVYLLVKHYIDMSLESDLLDVAKYYDGSDSCMFVAECEGRVIGMVGVDTKDHHKSGVAELQRMSVCPSARGKGIATLLVNKVIEYCKEKKYDKMVLCTTSVQYAAVGLYKKHGFKFVKKEQYPHYLLYNVYFLFYEKNI